MILKIERVDGIGWIFPQDNSSTVNMLARKKLDWDTDFAAIPEIQQLSQKDIVVDVGAYVGDTARMFLNRGARVIAFEPQIDAFCCLAQNCPEAFCVNAALGNGELVGLRGGEGGNTAARPAIINEGNLKTLRLDDFPLSKLTFLKIDVEGFECRVLTGASQTISRFNPLIHIEVNPHALEWHQNSTHQLLQMLSDFNYATRETFAYGRENWDLLCTPK